MRDDVEDRVRAALREGAEEITPETLRRSTLPEPQRSDGRKWLVAACVAAVVAVAAPVAVVSLNDSAPPPGPSTSTAQHYVGYRWQVESITRNGRTTPVPADVEATATFMNDREMTLYDSVNWLRCNIKIDASTDVIAINGGLMTEIGYSDEDPVRVLVSDVMEALALAKQATVSATESHLTIATGDFRIVFKRDGVATTKAPPRSR
ncbi:hypothetical protein FKR81_01770 [Lentzea tibetensis]|uniref:DUF306 domain-containing protein n=1 Tax=Lentzea tibetensis TaxID=2591470 RepID=A0A563F3G5_9PSEU|nr:hypothetical protein [Lentzea tibetensis]TWP54311.1 hypothetical protein FKR81_01770 [Lentzea tibetensis]